MATAERRAEVVWNGDLMKGSGTFDLASGGDDGADISFASCGEPERQHLSRGVYLSRPRSCYAMALS